MQHAHVCARARARTHSRARTLEKLKFSKYSSYAIKRDHKNLMVQ